MKNFTLEIRLWKQLLGWHRITYKLDVTMVMVLVKYSIESDGNQSTH